MVYIQNAYIQSDSIKLYVFRKEAWIKVMAHLAFQCRCGIEKFVQADVEFWSDCYKYILHNGNQGNICGLDLGCLQGYILMGCRFIKKE